MLFILQLISEDLKTQITVGISEDVKTQGGRKMKIDTAKIEGYENMTAEEKLAALENFEIEAEKEVVTDDAEITRLKQALSKSNSECADWKRKMREKMTEAEQIEANRIENENAMKIELENLRKEKTISNYKAQYLALGYEANLAEKTALAMADGDMNTVFANQQIFNETQKSKIETELLNKQPALSTGSTPTAQMLQEAELDKIRRYAGLK